MERLDGIVALVTGASRGVGKGVALSLGEAGAVVYVTGRTTPESESTTSLPCTVDGTGADLAARRGGAAAIACDHRDDEAVRSVFARIDDERARLHILVNNVRTAGRRSRSGRSTR